jgi:signal transduction histidine kinase
MMHRMKEQSLFRRIRWHLVGWNVLVLSLILGAVSVGVYVLTAHQLMAQVDHDLVIRSMTLHDSGHREHDDVGGESLDSSDGFFTLLIAPDGTVLANPQGIKLTLVPQTLTPPQFLTVTVKNQSLRLFVSTQPPGFSGYLLVVGKSLAPVQQALHRLLIGLLLGGIGGLGLSFIGAWFLAGRALIPIEQAFRRQLEFVADASHELRTPLTVLRATADLLDQHRNEPLSANPQLWDDFRHDLARLERLANDLLLLARADLNELDLAVAPVDLALITEDIIRRVTPLATQRGLQLHFQPPDEHLEVEVDPDRYQQLLLILLDNALKYTPPPGDIMVILQRHGRMAQILVRDTGEGIAPEHLPRLFDRFYRVDRARTRQQGGAGLGLAIAWSIVHAHRGTIRLESTLGQGTTVIVALPLTSSAASSHAFSRVKERVESRTQRV